MKRLNYLIIMPCFVKNSANETIFPLGIAYVSSSMKKAGFNVFTLNLNHADGDDYEVLRKNIEENSIDVVLTGGLSFQYSIIRELVDMVREIKKNVQIIVGGGIITGDPVPAMTALETVDFGVIGEGDVTVCELCRELENERKFSSVNGIIYKNTDGQWVRNADRPDIADLDSLPFPDYEGFELDKHLKQNTQCDTGSSDTRKQLNSFYIIGSRSCPYNCTFCFHTSGKKYRQRSLDNIFLELDFLVKNYGIQYIGIQDELFSHNKQRIMEFCRRIKNYNIGWWAQFRVDAVDREIVEMIKDSGCELMGFGLESADNRILKSMRKGTKIEQIEESLKMVYELGMPFIGTFIFGDKEETLETANNTINWWKNHIQYRIDLRLIMIYPGSALYKYALETGIIKDPVKFLKDGCPQVNVSKLTDLEFADLTKKIMEAPIDNAVEFRECVYKNNTLVAKCAACNSENTYKDVVFFLGSYLSCHNCGQKHNVSLVDEVVMNINKNIGILLKRYRKIGIWAINYHVKDLFNRLGILNSENIFPMDLSKIKQNMTLNNKKILHPDILLEQDIKAVIVGVPAYKLQIETQIRDNYKNVVDVIDICDLIREDYRVD